MIWVLKQNKEYIAQIDEFSIKGAIRRITNTDSESIEKKTTEKVFYIYGYNKDEDELYELGEYETEEASKVAMSKICTMLNEDKKCIQMP